MKNLQMMNEKKNPDSRWERWIPGIRMIRGYQLSWFPKDSRPDPCFDRSHCDLAACDILSEFHEELSKRGIRMVIANLQDNVRDRLVRGWEGAAIEQGLFAASVGAAVHDLQVRSLSAFKVTKSEF